MKKFELISSQTVSLPLCGSLLQRGAPTRRASEKVGSNRTKSDMILSKEKRKNFKELLYNSNGATGGLNKKLLSVVRLRH
ncbi:MAG: hypothetical protein NTY75_01330 [Candidatus Shapirobacteria bacterium]|nr:hypothetical protein [Candidatus Shapirobacteria bacterium]